MMHALEITVQHCPEVLERLLRVTRHRGFTVTQMQVRINDDASMAVDLWVEAERAIELLSTQLDKLIDVTHCKVLSAIPLNKVANG
ncbi:MAG: acetolactate synthase 2 small subunit [Shewanella psychromarinicola]|jgi:acetolactate synthase II small subunit|uniref:Acetolactate synthase 2 small subunit n=1 Tax=Shewanella psychromarinicola TaxID=2487742 RepID=A0A3N4E016_9GAMM|nr:MULTISPECIES: acetolactate synthase 2 small subunit [Shewanella]AZG33859.1 acetolactate synthase 2 small subunit [Shewanella psychromarinicola]MCL1080843.1 acetolactate synthase 2 small subunit [Shewanella psychromarinicola]PKG78897.1 acetolactate synthase 2 small subunit [Shewanella sp. Actino-trap-3]RPA31505.1 acetolactate synthase 2 small subunit [Shewanella psychromarinicola]|tara:strand:- start:10390 stop:10647 length:258 start_codon:yes stop_codon:yes gene_type:complete